MWAFLWSTSYLSHCHLFHKITSIVMDLRFTAEAGRTISEHNISRGEKGKIVHKEKLTTALITERLLHHKSSEEISETDKVTKLIISEAPSILKLTKSRFWQWELEVFTSTDIFTLHFSVRPIIPAFSFVAHLQLMSGHQPAVFISLASDTQDVIVYSSPAFSCGWRRKCLWLFLFCCITYLIIQSGYKSKYTSKSWLNNSRTLNSTAVRHEFHILIT